MNHTTTGHTDPRVELEIVVGQLDRLHAPYAGPPIGALDHVRATQWANVEEQRLVTLRRLLAER